MTADFALKLRSFLAVIVVDVYMRRMAERTGSLMRSFLRIAAVFDRTKRFAVLCLILGQKELEVFMLTGRINNRGFS